MFYLVPAMEILWGVCTLLQYRVTSFAELAAYRFLVGWFEAAFFPAMHYIFGMLLACTPIIFLTPLQAPGTERTSTGDVLASSTLASPWAPLLRL
jgi:hypothetical protein